MCESSQIHRRQGQGLDLEGAENPADTADIVQWLGALDRSDQSRVDARLFGQRSPGEPMDRALVSNCPRKIRGLAEILGAWAVQYLRDSVVVPSYRVHDQVGSAVEVSGCHAAPPVGKDVGGFVRASQQVDAFCGARPHLAGQPFQGSGVQGARER